MNKKNKTIFTANIIVIIIIGLAIFMELFIYTNLQLFLMILITMLVCVIGITIYGNFSKEKELPVIYYTYIYRPLLEKAFAGDRRKFNKLLGTYKLIENNKVDKAKKILDGLLKDCRNSEDKVGVYLLLSFCYREEDDDYKMLDVYHKIAEIIPTNADIWNHIGFHCSEIDDINGQGEALKKSLLYNPDNAIAHVNMADYYISMGNYEEALKHTQKAISIDNSLANAYSMSATVYAHMGDEYNANKYAKLFIEKKPSDQWIKYRINDILYQNRI